MGKLHNLVIHIRASASRTAEFVESASRRIPLDNRTRWNSWYHTLKVAQEQVIKEALVAYIEKYRDTDTMDRRDILSPEIGTSFVRSLVISPSSRELPYIYKGIVRHLKEYLRV